ncbi:hypothetical protein H488_0115190 [Kocuria sp. UCD-OTCP]|nr:hypothetical protein H488_0115190 [Kocuria sp. UCD-OTCP]
MIEEQGDPVTRTRAELEKMAGQAVRPGVELGVAQTDIVRVHGEATVPTIAAGTITDCLEELFQPDLTSTADSFVSHE